MCEAHNHIQNQLQIVFQINSPHYSAYFFLDTVYRDTLFISTRTAALIMSSAITQFVNLFYITKLKQNLTSQRYQLRIFRIKTQ